MRIHLGNSYEERVVRISHFIILSLGVLSLFLAIFVYDSVWSIISYPTVSIYAIILTSIGLALSDSKLEIASALLVGLVIAGILTLITLSLSDGELVPFVTGTFSLTLPILLSAFLFPKERIPLASGAVLIALVVLSYANGGNLPDGLHQPSYYAVIAILLSTEALILYLWSNELEKRKAELEQQKNKLESAYQTQRYTLSTIRHEIRQPLKGLEMTMNELASQADYPLEATQKKLTSARNAVTFIDTIVGNIQHIQKTDNTSTRYQLINLQSLLDDVVISFANSSIVFEAVLSTEHDYFYGDIVAIKQILYNLISNSIRHTQTGTVLVGIGVIDDKFMIGVSDTGIGIKPEDQEHMFNLYTKGAASKGQGIGLAVVKQIVEQHNGTIEFQSSPNEDTTFIISLPVIQKKFLYFEDNAFDREYMRQIFEDIPGWDITIFPNPLNWHLEIETHQPDIVFLDIDMPHIQGDDVVIEAKPMFPHITFIAYTTNSDQEYRDHYRTLPFDGYIPKTTKANTREIIVECVSRIRVGADIWF